MDSVCGSQSPSHSREGKSVPFNNTQGCGINQNVRKNLSRLSKPESSASAKMYSNENLPTKETLIYGRGEVDGKKDTLSNVRMMLRGLKSSVSNR